MSSFCQVIVMILAMGNIHWSFSAESKEANLPYVPGTATDLEGNEWLIEQNGTIQQSNSDSMIGNCMSLHFGNQQFYTQQALTTADGQEIVMPNTQAVAGVRITRRVYLIKAQPAVLYVEEFHNITTRDLTFSFELHHHLKNPAKEITSDSGRTIKEGLEQTERGLFAIPGDNQKNAPALFFMMRSSSAASTTMKVRVQNNHQISIPQSITIPAGQTRTFIHAIAQIRSNSKTKKNSIAQNTESFTMERYIDRLPKAILKQSINLGDATDPWNLSQWLPDKFWGITSVASDQLIAGKNSIIKGQAKLQGLTMSRTNGKQIGIEPTQVAAIAGQEFTGSNTSWVYLRDGQRWKGHLQKEEITFSLLGGINIPIQPLDRLILSKTKSALEQAIDKLTHTLMELKSGERIAIKTQGELMIEAVWGKLKIPWSEIIALKESNPGDFGQLLMLKNGSKLRVLQPERVAVETLQMGRLELEAYTMQGMISPMAEQYAKADLEPSESYIDMVDEQRLVGKITTETLTIQSKVGKISIHSKSIHEMKKPPEQNFEGLENRFKLELWGSGTLEGDLQEEMIHIEGEGYSWDIPNWQIRRVVNPVPSADPALLRKIAAWINDLGSDDWKTREAATFALRELGSVAKTNLKDAQRTTKDAEIARRLEELLEVTTSP